MLIKIKQDNMPNPNKKGLMQYDPMTGMPVAQPGSTPMFPVSNGFVGGSTAKFNPMINQYAQADPLANAAYASQPMPALAQQYGQKAVGTLVGEFPPSMKMQKVIKDLPPKEEVKTEVIKPTMSMTKEVRPLRPDTGYKEIKQLPPTMHMHREIKPLEVKTDTLTYGQKVVGRRLQQKRGVAQVVTQEIGPSIISGAANLITGVPIAKAAREVGSAASNVLSKIKKGAKEYFEGKNPADK